MIITLMKANFSANNIGTVNSFSVLTNLSTGLIYNGATSANKDGTFTATINVAENYIFNSLTVTMGGVIVPDCYVIEDNVITITVTEVNGIIVLTGGAKPDAANPDFGGILLELDFTKKTINDYINDGVIYNKENKSVLTGTYDENGLTVTNKAGSHGLMMTTPIKANQDLWMEIVMQINPYDAEKTVKTEALYPYCMMVSGTDDHESHNSNCFTPAWYNNNPAANWRMASGKTLSNSGQAFNVDGEMHSYKCHYNATEHKWYAYKDGEPTNPNGSTEFIYNDEESYGCVLGTHYGYSSANNYGFTGGMVIKSLKIWKE